MEPLFIMVPGLVGGLAIAFLLFHRQRASRQPTDLFYRERLSTDLINMAHVRVAGVGGLGLVAMATWVAFFVPAIRYSMLTGLTLGVMFAAALVAYRRRTGPMPSSGQRPGANTTLAIADPISPALVDRHRPTDVNLDSHVIVS